MFKSKKSKQNIEINSPTKIDTTIISSSTNFIGDLNSTGLVRVDGYFEGNMEINGSLIVGEKGYIKGNIKGNKITISGKVEGNIYSSELLELINGCKLYGDIEVLKINISEGVVFDGKCTMIKEANNLDDTQ